MNPDYPSLSLSLARMFEVAHSSSSPSPYTYHPAVLADGSTSASLRSPNAACPLAQVVSPTESRPAADSLKTTHNEWTQTFNSQQAVEGHAPPTQEPSFISCSRSKFRSGTFRIDIPLSEFAEIPQSQDQEQQTNDNAERAYRCAHRPSTFPWK